MNDVNLRTTNGFSPVVNPNFLSLLQATRPTPTCLRIARRTDSFRPIRIKNQKMPLLPDPRPSPGGRSARTSGSRRDGSSSAIRDMRPSKRSFRS